MSGRRCRAAGFSAYLEVGPSLLPHRHDTHPYGLWIDTDEGEVFVEAVGEDAGGLTG